jgi:hypothetical protein
MRPGSCSQNRSRSLRGVAAQPGLGVKPTKRRALSLLAFGYAYREICELTGRPYTKVDLGRIEHPPVRSPIGAPGGLSSLAA